MYFELMNKSTQVNAQKKTQKSKTQEHINIEDSKNFVIHCSIITKGGGGL